VLGLNATDRLFLYRGVVDFRKGFDGLCGLVRNQIGMDPMSGDVFIFLNRGRNRIKLLRWEYDGFAVYYKRLEKGSMEVPSGRHAGTEPINYAQLAMILKGISLEQRAGKPRFTMEEKKLPFTST